MTRVGSQTYNRKPWQWTDSGNITVSINTVKQKQDEETMKESSSLSVVDAFKVDPCEPAVSQKWKTDSIYNNLVLLDWHYIKCYTQTLQDDRL